MNYSPDTIKGRKTEFRRFFAWTDERAITQPGQVTLAILERYQKHLYHYRDPETNRATSVDVQRHAAVALRGFFSWMRKRGHLRTNPASDLEAPRAEHKLPMQGLTPEEVQATLATPNVEQAVGLRDRAILETFYSTGIRRSELAHLQVTDVDPRRGTLIVRQGKGKTDRVVPIGQTAVEWIEKYRVDARPALVHEPDHGFLFVMARGGPMSPKCAGETVKRCLKAAGVEKNGSCHLFRHAMATHMLDNGVARELLQKMLGHEDSRSTDIYTKVSIRTLKEAHTAKHPSEVARPETKNSDEATDGSSAEDNTVKDVKS
jgi:integrase/recombinase XerD